MILGNSEDYTKTFITVCFLRIITTKHCKQTPKINLKFQIADDETLSNFVYAQKLNYVVLIRYIIVWQRDNKKGMYLTLPKIRDFQVLQE